MESKTPEELAADKALQNGCFNLIIAILGAFAIGGIYGWPIGILALIAALCSMKLVSEMAREKAQ